MRTELLQKIEKNYLAIPDLDSRPKLAEQMKEQKKTALQMFTEDLAEELKDIRLYSPDDTLNGEYQTAFLDLAMTLRHEAADMLRNHKPTDEFSAAMDDYRWKVENLYLEYCIRSTLGGCAAKPKAFDECEDGEWRIQSGVYLASTCSGMESASKRLKPLLISRVKSAYTRMKNAEDTHEAEQMWMTLRESALDMFLRDKLLQK